MARRDPFKYFKSSPEVIRLAVMLYVRFPLSLRNVEDLLHERGIDVSHETVRYWWNRFGPVFAADIRKKRAERLRAWPQWQWHVDEVFVKINGRQHYLWRAVDQDGEVVDVYLQARGDGNAAKRFFKRLLRSHGDEPRKIVTEKLRSYGVAHRELIPETIHSTQRYENNWAEQSQSLPRLIGHVAIQQNERHHGGVP